MKRLRIGRILQNGASPVSTRQALRELMNGKDPFIAADCYSALSGRIIEHIGFKAAYMGGHATGMMHYAIPDCGILTQIAAEVRIPVGAYGKLVPGLHFSLFTDVGTAAAARSHFELATYLFEPGELPSVAFGFRRRTCLSTRALYDSIVHMWASRTGRPIRVAG